MDSEDEKIANKPTGTKAKSILSKHPSEEEKIVNKPTGAKAKSVLSKYPSEEEKIVNRPTRAKAKPVLSKQPTEEEKLINKPTRAKAKPALSKQPSKEEARNKKPTGPNIKRSLAKQFSIVENITVRNKKGREVKENHDPIREAKNVKKFNEAKDTYLDLVREAIETAGKPRKGASVYVIKKYISDKGRKGNLDYHIKKAIMKGVEEGIWKQTCHTGKNGAIGSFALVKRKTQRKISNEEVLNEERHVSDSETFIKVPNPLKTRNLSDTLITYSTPKLDRHFGKAQFSPERVDERQESSDTEVVAKPKVRKSMKSYSSDTELNLSREKTTKDKKGTKAAHTKIKKLKTKNLDVEEEKKQPTLKNGKVQKRKLVKGFQSAKGVDERQESSDTEVVAKPKVRKSMKSYSSDTELNLLSKKETTEDTEGTHTKPEKRKKTTEQGKLKAKNLLDSEKEKKKKNAVKLRKGKKA